VPRNATATATAGHTCSTISTPKSTAPSIATPATRVRSEVPPSHNGASSAP
jgi:hypothetical protein